MPTSPFEQFNTNMTELANAIRTKSGIESTTKLTVPEMTITLDNIPENSASSVQVTGPTVNIPAGNYKDDISKTVESGSVNDPTASKSAVSNNSVTVTPSVTSSTGYITGATKTGTGVSVTASELVSGNKALISSTQEQVDIDVTNYATVSIAAIPGGTGGVPIATKGTVSSHSINVTPSVTNETGYIIGGTVVGDPVTVSASELVSGAKTISSAGDTDVTNYSTASVGEGTITSGAGAASISDPTYNSTSGKFDQSASGTVAAPTVGVSGWVSSTEGTKNTNSISGSKSLDKISIQSTNSGTTTVTPSINKNSISISGVTDAASGDATTSAPTSGVYVAVQSSENTGTLTSTPEVTSAGYGTSTTGQYTATAGTSTVGANASAVTYVPVKTGSATTPTDSITSDPTISWDSTNNKIKATYSGSKSITPTVNAGWVASGTSGTISTSGTASIDPATLDANLAAGNIKDGVTIFNKTGTFSDSSTVSSGQAAASAGNILSGKSAFLDGAELKGTMPNQGAVTNTITTQGGTYTIPAGYHNGSGVVTASVAASTLDNSIISGEAVEESTGDYGWKTTVDVPAGYHNSQKLEKTFSEIFPAPETPATATQMLLGYQAYNKSGVLMTGTMPNNGETGTTISTQGGTYSIPSGYTSGGNVTASINNGTITSGAGTATVSDPAYDSTNADFDMTVSGTVAAPTVNTAGYVSSSAGTKNTNTISGSKTLAKIKGSTSITGTTTKQPAISRQAFTITNVTDAASGAATTTAPTSGVYVKVNSAANTGRLTATPSVSTAGYGTSTQHGITGNTATVGASASADTYVPITTTSASVSGDTVSYGTGWIASGSKTVSAGTISAADSSLSENSFTPTLTYNSTNDNFTYGGSANATGTAQAKVTTSGYVTSAKNTSKSLSATVSATGSVAKVATGVDITGTTTKSPTLARTAKPSGDTWVDAASGAATTTKPTSGPYVQIDAAANTGTLTATPKVTSAGYGTTSYYGSTAGTATVGSAKATTAYVPIKTGTTSKTDATTSATANAGTASVTTNPSASASASQTGMTAGVSSTATSYYFTSSASANSGKLTATGGSARAYVTASSASVTEGYTGGVSTSTTASDTGTKTGNTATCGDKTASDSSTIYLKAAALSASGSVTVSGSGNVNPGTNTISKNSNTNVSTGTVTTTKPSSGYYVAVDASTAQNTKSISVSGSGTASASVTTAGYAPDSLKGSGSVSGSGSASVTVPAKSASTTYVPITSGSLGTVSASKSISGNTATVTPSISNGTQGYSSMAGKSGIAVTVTAAEVCNSGSLTVTSNTTTGCTGYSQVITNIPQAIPIDVNTDAGMTAVLTSANIGKCYRFTGTTGTYTNGDLYVVQDV